jgi:hypothetical protein
MITLVQRSRSEPGSAHIDAIRVPAGAKNADALAWSAIAEMAGALALSRTVSDPEQSTQILRNSRAMVRSRIGLDRSTARGV